MDEIQMLQLDSIRETIDNLIDNLQKYIESLFDYMRNQTGVPKEYMQYIEKH